MKLISETRVNSKLPRKTKLPHHFRSRRGNFVSYAKRNVATAPGRSVFPTFVKPLPLFLHRPLPFGIFLRGLAQFIRCT